MKAGVVFLLLGILAASGSVVASLGSEGYWYDPVGCFNMIGGIALSVCGVGLLAFKKDEVNPLDSVTLRSIGMMPSGRIAARMAVPEKIMREKTGWSTSDIVPEIAVVKDVDSKRIEPVRAFRKVERESVESLIKTASSLLAD